MDISNLKVIIMSIFKIIIYIDVFYIMIKIIIFIKKMESDKDKAILNIKIDNTKEYEKLRKENDLLKGDIYRYRFDAEHFKAENEAIRKQEAILEVWETKCVDNKKYVFKNSIINNPIYNGKKAIIGMCELDSLMYIRSILLALGFSVDIVQNGEDLVKRISDFDKYDLAITDSNYKDGRYNANDVIKILRRDMGIDGLILLLVGDRELIHDKTITFDGYLNNDFKQKDLENILTNLIKCSNSNKK